MEDTIYLSLSKLKETLSVCLIYVICVCLRSGVQHILCCVVFLLFFFVLLPVFLGCPFLIAPSVFSNVYLPTFSTDTLASFFWVFFFFFFFFSFE